MSNKLQITDPTSLEKSTKNNKLGLTNALAAGLAAGLSGIELPRMFNQLVVFLLDGSGSMTSSGTSTFSKGQEVHQSVIKVVERLSQSKNKSSFDLAFWAFANENIEMFPIKPVKEFDLIKDCFNPCEYIKDYSNTLLNDLLKKVEIQVTEYLDKFEGQNRKALIIILGDGGIADYDKAIELKLKMDTNSLITFSSILFESPKWIEEFDDEYIEELKELFSKLASTEADYMSTVDPEKIRAHMINSVTKVSNTNI